MSDRLHKLGEVRRSLGTIKMMLGHTDAKLGKAVKGPQSERVLALREQLGRAYKELEKAEMWAAEIRALLAGEVHPSKGRSFASAEIDELPAPDHCGCGTCKCRWIRECWEKNHACCKCGRKG